MFYLLLNENGEICAISFNKTWWRQRFVIRMHEIICSTPMYSPFTLPPTEECEVFQLIRESKEIARRRRRCALCRPRRAAPGLEHARPVMRPLILILYGHLHTAAVHDFRWSLATWIYCLNKDWSFKIFILVLFWDALLLFIYFIPDNKFVVNIVTVKNYY